MLDNEIAYLLLYTWIKLTNRNAGLISSWSQGRGWIAWGRHSGFFYSAQRSEWSRLIELMWFKNSLGMPGGMHSGYFLCHLNPSGGMGSKCY